MSFSLPVTIVIAVVLFLSSAVDKRFNPEPGEVAPKSEEIAKAEPADTSAMTEEIISMQSEGEGYGFRVQIFSASSEVKALQIKESIRYRVPYNCHIHFDGDEYKVRVGDFLCREPADSLAEVIRLGEFGDAFVVECPISQTEEGFRVQVAAMENHASAITYARLVEADVEVPVHLVKDEGLWKVRIGDFLSKEEADDLSVKLRELGYQDVWVVVDNVYP